MDNMMCMNVINGRPCGYCMACRLNRQREKEMRLCHECESWKDKVFITLTYSDENLPENKSLIKKDVQDFMKRLRKDLGSISIKYFCCGEYGDEENYTGRPHYHLILFGVDMKSPVFHNLKYNKQKDVWYADCDAWKLGFVSLNPVTPARCAYVAKYCLKKLGGKLAESHYGERVPEFSLQSRGIGLRWCMDHADFMKKHGFLWRKGKKANIPRYYMDKIFNVLDKIVHNKYLDKVQHEKLDRDYHDWLEYLSQHPDMPQYEVMQQYKKDKHSAYVSRFIRRLQMKGKTNNV